MNKAFSCKILASLTALALLSGGCASAGDEGANRSGNDPQGNGQSSTITNRFLEFNLAINPNGEIDRTGRGIYAILLNAQGTPIEATDLDTFTDVIRFDGLNFDWYHRQAEVPNPGFNFALVGSLAGQAQVLPDGKSLQIILDLGESTSFINQFIPASQFTAHAITTDTQAGPFLGRLVDTLGQGPNIDSNSLQTVTIRRGEGAVEPKPQSYPFDPLNDTVIHSNLGSDYPYANFDIARFEVTAR